MFTGARLLLLTTMGARSGNTRVIRWPTRATASGTLRISRRRKRQISVVVLEKV